MLSTRYLDKIYADLASHPILECVDSELRVLVTLSIQETNESIYTSTILVSRSLNSCVLEYIVC